MGKVIEEDIGPSSSCSRRSSSSRSNSSSYSSSSIRCSSSCHIVEDIGARLIPSRGSVTQGEGCKEIGSGSKMQNIQFFL